MKNFDSSTLFKLTTNCEVETDSGSRLYTTNISGPSGMYLCPGVSHGRTNKAKINAAIEFISAFLSNQIKHLVKLSSGVIYYEDNLRGFLVNPNEATIIGYDTRGVEISRTTYALAIGATTYINECTPVFKVLHSNEDWDEAFFTFCDYAYYKVAKGVSYNVSNSTEDAVTSEFNRAVLSDPDCKVLVGDDLDISISEASSTPTKKTSKKGVYEEYKEGLRRLPYTFDCDDKDIVSLSFLEDFVPTETFFNLAKKIEYRLNKVAERMAEGKTGLDAIKKDFINIRLAGSPGTGKTYVAQALSAALGIPFYSVNIQKNTEEEEFEGKTRAVDGAFSFVTTDFLKGYENGGIIVLEEANLADPGLIMGALGQAIEPPFYIKKNGYETVHRHPMTIVIVTQNIGTNGSKMLNQAFENRLYQNYLLTDPTKEEVLDFLEVSGQERRVCEWVYNAYSKIKNLLCSNEIAAEDTALCLSVRSCFGALQEIEEGIKPHDAIWNTIGGQVITSNFDLYEPVKNTIFSLPNLKV